MESAALAWFPNPVQTRDGRRVMQDSEYEAKAELYVRDRNDPCTEMWGAFT